MSELHSAFPRLAHEGFRETSPCNPRYNCIAWAAGAGEQWWDPAQAMGCYWPSAIPREQSVETLVRLFETLGYSPCRGDEIELGFEKVALYALAGEYTHAARQLREGKWTSKLGSDIDIEHTLAGLEGPAYGSVAQILKRPRLGP